jgi:hypothetical protein
MAITAALAIFAAITVAITFLAIGLFVFALPVLLIAPVLYYFRPRPKLHPVRADVMEENPTSKTAIIEGEFRVVDVSEVEGKTEPPSLANS